MPVFDAVLGLFQLPRVSYVSISRAVYDSARLCGWRRWEEVFGAAVKQPLMT